MSNNELLPEDEKAIAMKVNSAVATQMYNKEISKEVIDPDKLLSLGRAWGARALKLKDNELLTLSKKAIMKGNYAYFDQRMPPVKDDSELELWCRNHAVESSALRDVKQIHYPSKMFANRGYIGGFIRQVETGMGGPMFEELCALNLGKYSAEWAVYHKLRDLISPELAKTLGELLFEKHINKLEDV
jgi:hypothetical protein